VDREEGQAPRTIPGIAGGSPPSSIRGTLILLTRLALAGVDLSVLPEDDREAPADRRRILAGARRFLRSTPAAIADFAMDPQEVAPVLYPAHLAHEASGEGEG